MAAPTTTQSVFRYPLTAVLAGEGSVRILRELASHGGFLSPRGLADRVSLTVQGIRRALKRLEGLGVVCTVGTVDRRLYQLNAGHPMAPALRALFAAEETRVSAVFNGIREAVTAESVRTPILAAWVYGSVARGEDLAGSDLDVAAVFDVSDTSASAARHGTMTSRVEKGVESLREMLAPVEQAQHVTLSIVGLSRDDVTRLSSGDPWWITATRDALPLVGPAPSALAARLGAARALGKRS